MEILAPCGSPRHIAPAVHCGANAVYLGARALSARAGAENFTREQLREATDYCHAHGVRVYQTVNTLLRDDETELLYQVLEEACQARVDALIVQDWGVARLVRTCLPGMELHASTQTSIHTPGGLAFAQEAGFSRVVLARELSAGQIRRLADATTLGIEVFVHGALCVSVSGQCLLSAMLGGRSGNRGQCAQPCRLDFAAGERRHALSLKDLSLVEQVERLRDAGATALKIEGRMKRPEYVAAAVHAVKAALDGEPPDMRALESVFSRSGFTDGYFAGHMKDMGGIRRKEDVEAAAGVLPSLERLYKAPCKRCALECRVTLRRGAQTLLTATDGVRTVSVAGAVPQEAEKHATGDEALRRQLSKLGGTQYELAGLTAEIDPGLMLPAAEINELRRSMVAAMDAAIQESHTPPPRSLSRFPELHAAPADAPGEPKLRVHCRTFDQWLAVRDSVWQGVLPHRELLAHADAAQADAKRLLAAPPRFMGGEEDSVADALARLRTAGFHGLLCQNAGHLTVGRDAGCTLHGGFGLNVCNSHAARELEEFGLADLTLSPELKLSRRISTRLPVGVVAYGRLPLMLLARCPHRDGPPAGDACRVCAPLTDRMGKRFPLRCDGPATELLNPDILWMADRLSALAGFAFADLLLDRDSDPAAVVRAYTDGGDPPGDCAYTRGLLYRGVL